MKTVPVVTARCRALPALAARGARRSRTARMTPAWVALLLAGVSLLAAGCTALPVAQTAPADHGRFSEATVVRVVDGDTAVFRLAGGGEEKTRFIGVDTPESTTSVEFYGTEAAAYTASVLVPGRTVWLERDVQERDRYGRLLAYVWLERPGTVSDAEIRVKMFNAHLALEGYAQQLTIQPNSAYADFFTAYVREARSAEKGLWDAGLLGGVSADPAAPQRLGSGTSAAGGPATGAAYVGNLRSRVFHRPECPSVGDMSARNRTGLASRQEAVGQGYRPCGRCDP